MATKTSTRSKAKPASKTATAKAAAPKVSRAKTAIPKPPSSLTKAATVDQSVSAKPSDVDKPTKDASVSDPSAPQDNGFLRKSELVSAVADRSDMPRNKARSVVEATLAVLGDAIADGRGLNLPGIGKLKPQRTKQVGTTKITVAKIRQDVPGSD